MELHVIIAAALLVFLSVANGANDVSKAIATLAGAGVTSVRNAVRWGAIWTLAGSLSGLYLGKAIIKNITQNVYVTPPDFTFAMALAIGFAPTLWVLLATWRKWPVSTTHAIVGGLLGTGIVGLGMSGIAWHATLVNIALPLLVSPLLAITLAYVSSPLLQRTARVLERVRICLLPVPKLMLVQAGNTNSTVALDDCVICDCDSPQARSPVAVAISVDHLHWLTSGLLSFSRGLNDTPKLVAVTLPFLLAAQVANMPMHWMFVFSAIAMMAGGLAAGSRITKVLGFHITTMNHAEGFSANAVATSLVLGASTFGLPVSTTHVSASAIMGVGLADHGDVNRKTVTSMVFAWLVTVPVSGVLAAIMHTLAGSL